MEVGKMQRLYWIELIGIMASAIALINGAAYIAIGLLLFLAFLSLLFIKKHDFLKIMFQGAIAYLILYLLAFSGSLDYEGLEVYLLFLSIALSLLFESLKETHDFGAMLSPYLFSFLALLIFTILVIALKDSAFITEYYPLGSFSLLCIIDIVFLPYLACLTLSFLVHEYNK